MSTPPPSHKRQKSNASPTKDIAEVAAAPTILNTAPPPRTQVSLIPPPRTPPPNPRKRRASTSPKLDTLPPGTTLPRPEPSSSVSIPSLLSEDSGKKRTGRTNTPWTATEEQRLKQMRDVGNSWSEIAKAFPTRTEGSVKKHWYKDMHYAEFAEDESVALREAIREYEANKWKAIGAKLGKPAKACEQYAKEHFKNI
ncbi:uncharacterized protein HMPREF1541_07166 [Cyphellophora europaea CBS 101466]|uniref:HTH myb-type domain-containing protein n=1 Tax=Cyphellophora europaea (strain CBS 101466) TaxID=1220924 RepID=W2RP95_CYPE1|nr:uncharacterized protein HMPREF1541_07166 [Cyphellophora europaea CBS 101466]ETN37544.1 hypothetical protein HMPREF1541_07166 [Cyphellophora europaea CBS 101466]